MSNIYSQISHLNKRSYTILVLAIVYMFNFIDRQILAILLPQIRDEFGVSDTYLGFLSGTAFALFYITLGIPVARYADRFNRRNIIAIAVALWSVMTALSGFATNIWHLTAARIGVGIGEAGCSPPAHSIIADLYPPEKRSTAMGFYTLGISAGIMIAYFAGGWVAQNINWRAAFFIAGVPGLALAAIVRFTLIEPNRGASEERTTKNQSHNLKEIVSFLILRRSFVHMIFAASLSSFVGYSVISFMPSFMMRSFDLDIATLGSRLGLILGIAGGVGYFFGGYLADQFGRESYKRSLHFIAKVVFLTTILLAMTLLSNSSTMALILFILPAATMNIYLAPVLSQAQSLVGLRMRATTSAIVLFVINLIGLAIGPLITGIISDILEQRFHEDSMRYSLLIITSIILPWAVWHYYCAGKYIDSDLLRATEKD